ncbi:MAG: hypothetical protein AB8H86_27965 [Polyangiales bacterium]
MRSTAFFSLIALSLFGCGDPPDPTPFDGGTPDAGSDAGPCDECTPLPFQVELRGQEGPVVLEDGVVASWEWGFQGGTMITPRIVFDEGVVEDGQEVSVQISHSPDPNAPDTYGEVTEFPGVSINASVGRDSGGRLLLAPINDQLGWDDLDGTRLVLSVTVRTGNEQGTQTGAISLQVPEGPCDIFEQTGDGCRYYQIPGIAVANVEPTEGVCMDPQRVALEFLPNAEEAAAECATELGFAPLRTDFTYTLSSGFDPPLACLDALSLATGARVPAHVALIAAGGCSPINFRIDADDGSCSELCNAR